MFDWDEQKNQLNIAKHGVSFEQAKLIFDNFTVDRIDDRFFYDEIRYFSLGRVVLPLFWRSPTPTEMVFVGSYRLDRP